MSDLQKVLEELENHQNDQQPQQIQAEIFKEKKYWCRYFDYSNGKSPENVIMQYDRSCKLYNIFEIKGANGSSGTSQASSSSSSAESSTKPQVLDISGIKNKSSDLKSKELRSN